DENAIEDLALVGVSEALAFHEHLDALLRLLHAGDACLEQDLVESRLEPSRQVRDQISIRAGQQAVRHFDDGDLRAERRVDRAELEADIAAADNEEGPGNL